MRVAGKEERCKRKKPPNDDSSFSTTTTLFQKDSPSLPFPSFPFTPSQAEAEASAATPSEAEPEAEAAAAPASSADDASAAAAAAGATSARFGLNFLWLDKNVGVAVDALYARASASEGGSSSTARAPLTEYFMWPRKDAWEELKAALEAKPWVPERDRVLLLNRTTEVINFWQDEGAKHSVEEAREKFPDCVFSSS